jgi:hypothetical protein
VVAGGIKKRRSKYGPQPKDDWLKKSEFVGVKMTPDSLKELDGLVKRRGKGATRSSVIVELIQQAWAEADARQRQQPEGDPGATPQRQSPEDREAAIAAARQRVIDARGERAKTDAMIELERLRGNEPSFGGKS